MAVLPDPKQLEAVIFDAGGVLLLPNFSAGRPVLRSLGCDPNEADWVRAHYVTMAAIDSEERPDSPALRRLFASTVGVPDEHLDTSVSLIEELVVSTPWAPVPEACQILKDLVAAGLKLAVVSNADGKVAEELETGHVCSTRDGSLPRVEVIVDSHLVGMEKPDPRIFHLALDALQVPADRAIHLGDSVRFDVNGAARAGLHPIHLDPHQSCPGDHSHFLSLDEFRDWLVGSDPDRP